MTRIWTLLLLMNCNVYSFPSDLTIYEFGTKEHAFGGLRWDDSFNHPKPYGDSASVASLFQYLSPHSLPTIPFPTSEYTLCWNMNVRVFGAGQTLLMRLFHDENREWIPAAGRMNRDYWHQLTFSPNRGTLIMTANMLSDKTMSTIWSGGR